METYFVSKKMEAEANAICATVVMHCYSGNDRPDTDEEKEAMRKNTINYIEEAVQSFAEKYAKDSSEVEKDKAKEYLRRKIIATEVDQGMIFFNNI